MKAALTAAMALAVYALSAMPAMSSSVSTPPYSDQVAPCLQGSPSTKGVCVRDVCGTTTLCYETFCQKAHSSDAERKSCVATFTRK